MLLRFSIAVLLALVMQAPTRGDPLSFTDQVSTLVTAHSLDQSATGDLNSDKRNPDVPEPSSLVPLALLLGGTWLLRKRVYR